MLENNVKELSPEKCKGILSGIVALYQDAETFDFEKLFEDPIHRLDYGREYPMQTKFGFEVSRFLMKEGCMIEPKQIRLD